MQHIVAKDRRKSEPKLAVASVDVDQPIPPARVSRMVKEILDLGTYSFTDHAEKEMANDDMGHADCVAVLRAGKAEPGELRSGTYRYRIRTSRMGVVVAFRSETRLVVVTAWRMKQ
jgi:hypothetical protein